MDAYHLYIVNFLTMLLCSVKKCTCINDVRYIFTIIKAKLCLTWRMLAREDNFFVNKLSCVHTHAGTYIYVFI